MHLASRFRHGLQGALLAGPVLMGAVAASAQPVHPPLMPTQDATVTYTVQPEGGQARSVTVKFGGGGRLMRMDGPQGQGFMVMDRAARSVTVVMTQQRSYMELASGQDLRNPFLLDAGMHFARTGSGSVLGHDCTTWAITLGTGSATACVTATGIVLQEDGVDGQGVRGHLVATAIDLVPVPASAFVPPPGYTRIAHPEQGPTGGIPGASPGMAPTMGPPTGAGPGAGQY